MKELDFTIILKFWIPLFEIMHKTILQVISLFWIGIFMYGIGKTAEDRDWLSFTLVCGVLYAWVWFFQHITFDYEENS